MGTWVEGWQSNALLLMALLPSCSHTSKSADVVLLCGDLNMHPRDLGCCLLKEWTGLRDAYVETQDFKVRGPV